MRKTLLVGVFVGMSLVVLGKAMIVNQPEALQLKPVEIEVASGEKVIKHVDEVQPEVKKRSIHSNISVAWKHPASGAMMSRRLTEEQAEEARQLMLEGQTMDQAMLAIPGNIAIMQAPAESRDRSALSAL